MNFKAFGNSLVSAYGVSPGWLTLLSAELGVVFANGGLDGAMFPDIAPAVYAITPKTEDAFVLALGTNDQRIFGENDLKLRWFYEGLLAETVWLATPTKLDDVTFEGTWDSTFAYGIGKNSCTHGDRLSFDLCGDVAYLAFIRQDVAQGSFSVTIDNVPKGVYSTSAMGLATYLRGVNGPSYWQGTLGPFCLRFAGLGDGAHHVVVEVLSPSAYYNKVYFDWAAGSEQMSPRVVLANTPRMHPEGYAAHGGSESNVFAYSNITATIARLLKRDGLNVELADWRGAVSSWQPDNLHPDQDAQTAMLERCECALVSV